MCNTCNGTIWIKTEFPIIPTQSDVIIVRTYLFLIEAQVLNPTISQEKLSTLNRIVEYLETCEASPLPPKLKESLISLGDKNPGGIKANDMSEILKNLIVIFEDLFLDLDKQNVIQHYTRDLLKQLIIEIRELYTFS